MDVAKLVVNLMGDATSYIQTLTTAQATLQTFASTTQQVVGRVTAAVGAAVKSIPALYGSTFANLLPVLQNTLPAALSSAYSMLTKGVTVAAPVAAAFRNVVNYATDATTAFVGFVSTMPGKLIDAIENKVAQVGSAFQALGKYIAIPAATLAGLSLKAFSDFDLAMTESTSIMSNLSNEQKVMMADLAKELSMKGKQGPTELAKAYYYLASAGYDANQAMAALPVVQNFATAGAFDLERATNLAAGAQAALGLRVADATQNMANMARVTNVLIRANTLANASAEQFSIALTTSAAGAGKAFGKDVEEVTAALVVLADQNIKAQEAGNMFGRMLRILSQSAVMHKQAYKDLKVDIFDPKTHNMRKTADIIEDLTKAFSKMSAEQRTATMKSLGWEAKLQGAMIPFLGKADKMREAEAKLRKASEGEGESARVAAEQMKAFWNQMQMTWNMVKVLAIEIGAQLAPAVLALVEPLKQAVKWFRELSKPTQEFILVAVSMTAALIGFFAVAVTGFMLLNALTGGAPILMGLILLGIVAASVAIAEFVHDMGGIGNTLAYLKQKGEEAWAWLDPVRIALKDFFMVLWFVARGTFDKLVALGLSTWDEITGGARISWDEVRRIIIVSIVGAEWVLLHFQQAAELMWAGIKYYSVSALNVILSSLFKTLGAPATAALGVFAGNWRTMFRGILDANYEFLKYLLKNASIAGTLFWQVFEGKLTFGQAENKLPTANLGPVEIHFEGIEVKNLKELEAKLKAEFEKLGAEAAKSFNKFYEEKMVEFTKMSFDNFYKKTFKDLYAKIGEGAQKVGMMMLGLNPADVEKQGEGIGESFNAGVNKTMGKFDAAIYRSAEAFSRIEAYRAQMDDDFNRSGPKHGGGRSDGTGLGHPHQKAVDVFAGQGGGGVGNVVARAEETVPILKDIRAILAGADKKPGIKVEAADLA